MNFQFSPCVLPEVISVTPKIFSDERGFFMEVYKAPLFKQNGITADFVQLNHSQSKRGTLRGLHYQINPHAQAKLVRVLVGEIFDVAVDIRKKSATFGKWVGLRLSALEKNMLYIPRGFAHGFTVLSDQAEVEYFTSAVYAPECDAGIIYNDPAIAIDWPSGEKSLSPKDMNLPTLGKARNNF